jgi:hypothetical protein
MAILKYIFLSCKRATFLISKKEEGRLTPLEKVQLKLHLNICDFCARFEKQTKFLSGNSIHLHDHTHATLSAQKKEEIKSLLKD